MGTDNRPPSREHVRSLRCYVLSPVNSGLDAITREHTELTTEKEALRDFSNAVKRIDCDVQVSRSPPIATDSDPSDLQKVQTAYRETVMSMEHYNERYHNTFQADIEAEFGKDVADVLCQRGAGQFNNKVKRTVLNKIDQRIADRERLIQGLNQEKTSLRNAQTELSDIVNSLAKIKIPEWYAEPFLERLNERSEKRQNSIHNHRSFGRIDGHSFCQYVYSSTDWTYPVLTAIGRFREAIVI